MDRKRKGQAGISKVPLTRIKSGAFARGFALAKVSFSAGARAAGHAVGNVFAADADRPERLRTLLTSQVGLLTRELGQLKGSLMKVGQMLSMFGEHFLPPEANALLKSLQSQSPPLAWPAIEKVLKRQLGAERLAELEIDPEPVASASLGQVHRARVKADGTVLSLKIQYPGVDKAIEGDLRALRSVMSMAKLLADGPKVDELFNEVREMLHQEVDYRRELELTRRYRDLLAGDTRYVVPEVFPAYSTGRVLATGFIEGLPMDGPFTLGLPQARRDALGTLFMDLYFRELFVFHTVQTDPHFGNYRLLPGTDGAPDRLALLDFGAVRSLEPGFLDPYVRMVRGIFGEDLALFVKACQDLGFLREGDASELVENFAGLCGLLMEPFADPRSPRANRRLLDSEGFYDFGASDLPKRVAREAAGMALKFKTRTPPRQVIFLDRKMGGVFIFLSVLKTRLNARPLLSQYLTGII